MNLIATLTREAFNEACAALCQEDADIIAETYPNLFAAYFTYNARAADVRPAASPGPAKAREPKASPAIDKASLDAAVLARVADLPDQRSATIAAAMWKPAVHGDDDKRFGDLVRASLTRLVTAGKVYQDGTRKNARFKVAVKAAEPEVAAE